LSGVVTQQSQPHLDEPAGTLNAELRDVTGKLRLREHLATAQPENGEAVELFHVYGAGLTFETGDKTYIVTFRALMDAFFANHAGRTE
jgi:hypothetical protein